MNVKVMSLDVNQCTSNRALSYPKVGGSIPPPATKILNRFRDLEQIGKIELGRVVVKLLYFFQKLRICLFQILKNTQIFHVFLRTSRCTWEHQPHARLLNIRQLSFIYCLQSVMARLTPKDSGSNKGICEQPASYLLMVRDSN